MLDFNISGNALQVNEKKYTSDKFHIVAVFRYEGDSSPDEEATVYGIESDDGVKGILVTSYGMYSDESSEALLEKLSIK